MEYTAIGDTTNTASRLEGMTKGTGHQLFIADSTRPGAASAEHDDLRAGRRARGARPQPHDHRLDLVRKEPDGAGSTGEAAQATTTRARPKRARTWKAWSTATRSPGDCVEVP